MADRTIDANRLRSERLIEAAERGDVNTVAFLLDQGVSPSAEREHREQTFHEYFHQYEYKTGKEFALSLAVAGGHWEVIRLLVARDAGKAARDDAVFEAVCRGDYDLSLYLLKHGASPNALRRSLLSLLVEEPLSYGSASLSSVTQEQSVLASASEKGHARLAYLLLCHGAAPEPFDPGQTLRAAAQAGQIDDVLLLLENGVAPDLPDTIGATPLMRASECGQQDVVSLLLARGAAVNARDHSEKTPLGYAADSASETIVRLLLDAGAEVKDATPLLSLAHSEGNTNIPRARASIMALLLDRAGNAISAADKTTILTAAVVHGSADLVKILLRSGASPDGIESDGELLRAVVRMADVFKDNAAQESRITIAQALLEYGANVNACDANGYTPLMSVAGRNAVPLVVLYLARGALPLERNKAGRTALDVAIRMGAAEAANLLTPLLTAETR